MKITAENKNKTYIRAVQDTTPTVGIYGTSHKLNDADDVNSSEIFLKPHQDATVMQRHKKRLLAFSTGTGKTITAISLCNVHEIKDILVICPKNIVMQWVAEMEKYVNSGTNITIMSKEEFKKQIKVLGPIQAIIVDEGHHFAGITSAMSKALYWYTNKHKTEYIYIATATPYCSTPLNIYTLAKHLGYNWNYMAFKEKFFYYIPMGSRNVPVQRPHMEDEVARLVAQIGDVVDMDEVVDVPTQTEEVTKCELTDRQLAEIKDIFDPVFIVRWTRQHQIENGFLYGEGDSEETKSFECNKTSEVIRLCEENKKIVVVARYTHQLELYQRELIARGIDVYTMTGQTKNAKKQIDAANRSERCVFLMQASCSAGFELPTFNIMVFASLSFSHVDHTQAKGRILRINNLHENRYVYLVADGVDQDVYNCIMEKKDFSLAIYNYKSWTPEHK